MVYHNPTPEEFKKIIEGGKVIVDFWASWCGPCRAQAPIVEELEETTEVDLIKINVDEEQKLTEYFQVSGIPTLLLYDKGTPVRKYVGLTSLDALKEAFGV